MVAVEARTIKARHQAPRENPPSGASCSGDRKCAVHLRTFFAGLIRQDSYRAGEVLQATWSGKGGVRAVRGQKCRIGPEFHKGNSTGGNIARENTGLRGYLYDRLPKLSVRRLRPAPTPWITWMAPSTRLPSQMPSRPPERQISVSVGDILNDVCPPSGSQS